MISVIVSLKRKPDLEAAERFVRLAGRFSAAVSVYDGRAWIDAKQARAATRLAALASSELPLEASGGDEREALRALRSLLTREDYTYEDELEELLELAGAAEPVSEAEVAAAWQKFQTRRASRSGAGTTQRQSLPARVACCLAVLRNCLGRSQGCGQALVLAFHTFLRRLVVNARRTRNRRARRPGRKSGPLALPDGCAGDAAATHH